MNMEKFTLTKPPPPPMNATLKRDFIIAAVDEGGGKFKWIFGYKIFTQNNWTQ